MNKKQETMVNNNSAKRKIYSLFSVLCFLFSLSPLLFNLFRPGFYSSDDGQWMVIRLTAFHESFRSGQIPVRWLSRLNHEYGYSVTNFLYPLPFYLAEPFYILTGDPVIAVKIIMGLAVISMAIGMFLFLSYYLSTRRAEPLGGAINHKPLTINLSAFAGALTYVYSPYVAYNLYTRGSLGELVALGIAPWVFWAIASKKLLLSSVLTAALITSHNVVALLFLPFIVFYNIYNNYKSYKIQSIFSLFSALAISAFFWFPALAEYRFVRASQIAVSDFGNEYLSLQNAFQRSGPITVLTNLGLPLFFLTENSKWLWDLFKPMQIIQFPWRLLSLFSFTSALIVSLSVSKLKNHFLLRLVFITFVTFMAFISAFPYLSPKSFFNYPPSYYQTNDDSTTVRNEYTPVWVKGLPLNRPDIQAKHYYPGLKLFINGIDQSINPDAGNGEIRTFGFQNESHVKFVWSETPLRMMADLISVAGLFIVLFLFKRQQDKN